MPTAPQHFIFFDFVNVLRTIPWIFYSFSCQMLRLFINFRPLRKSLCTKTFSILIRFQCCCRRTGGNCFFFSFYILTLNFGYFLILNCCWQKDERIRGCILRQRENPNIESTHPHYNNWHEKFMMYWCNLWKVLCATREQIGNSISRAWY